MRIGFSGMCVALLLLSSAAMADWSAPADGGFTEKQLENYLAMSKEWIATMKAAGKAVDGSQSGFTILAMYTRTNSDKFNDSLKKHGLAKAEFYWLGNKTWEAWNAVAIDKAVKQMDAEMAAETKKDTDLVATDKVKLALYQQALTTGRRVLTPEERAAAVKKAQADQQAAAEQVNQQTDEARTAAADISRAESEASSLEAAANSPPNDLGDDEKASYSAAKQAQAQAARDGEQDDRTKMADARQAIATAQAAVEAAIARARQPDVPQTEEERAEVRELTPKMIAQLQAEIANAQDTLNLLADTGVSARNAWIKERGKPNEDNVALMKSHAKEFTDVWHPKPPADPG
jgi:hypothetical protein